jgi:hypothetical protein
MTATANDRDWLNAIQANRRDMAAAFDRGDQAAKDRLRVEYDELEARRPATKTR